jgi:hypothetical protein
MRSTNSLYSWYAVDRPIRCWLSVDLSLAAAAISRSSSSGYAVNRRICCQFLYRSSFFLCRRDQ